MDKIAEAEVLNSPFPLRDDDPLDEATDLDTLEEEERFWGMDAEEIELSEYGKAACCGRMGTDLGVAERLETLRVDVEAEKSVNSLRSTSSEHRLIVGEDTNELVVLAPAEVRDFLT